jgi:hypothetical protein
MRRAKLWFQIEFMCVLENNFALVTLFINYFEFFLFISFKFLRNIKMSDLIEKNILIDKQTVFFVCDLQEKFRPAIDHFNEIVQVAQRLVIHIVPSLLKYIRFFNSFQSMLRF